MSTTTEKERKYEKWFAAMESGEYKQGTGKMCLVSTKGEVRYCCLGVLDVAVYGDKFRPVGEGSLYPGISMIDSVGCVTYPPRKRLTDMGLDVEIKQEEWKELQKYLGEGPFDRYDSRFGVSRYDALMEINDLSDSYQPVIDAIREMGWHKEGSIDNGGGQ